MRKIGWTLVMAGIVLWIAALTTLGHSQECQDAGQLVERMTASAQEHFLVAPVKTELLGDEAKAAAIMVVELTSDGDASTVDKVIVLMVDESPVNPVIFVSGACMTGGAWLPTPVVKALLKRILGPPA